MAENKKKSPFGTKTNTQGSNPFTVDHESSGVMEMPTLTKLLNRKKLGLSKDTGTIKTVSALTKIPAPQAPGKKNPVPAPAPSSSDAIALETENTVSEIKIESATSAPAPTQKSPAAKGPSQPPSGAAPSAGGEISLSLSGADSFQLETSGPATTSEAAAPAAPAPAIEAAVSISTPEPEQPSQPSLRIQAAKPRERETSKLALWEPKQLKAGPDPLGRGLATMLEKGAKSALFLAIVAPPPGSPVPHFVASAAVSDPDRNRLWTGMKWDPTVVPELWNIFVRTGFVELSPPGTTTNIKSNRNVVRAAFGVGPSEWLLLVRAGPAATCRGVLALIATRSILTELGPILPLIASPAPKKAAA